MDDLITVVKSVYPNLAIESYELIDKGWDSRVVRLNDRYIFRFPRREDSARCLQVERKILPELEQVVDLRIPHFEFFSASFDGFSTSFVGYEKIPGVELTRPVYQNLARQHKTQTTALQLGKFLSQLHGFPVERAKALGVTPRGGLKWWHAYFDSIQQKAFPLMHQGLKKWTLDLFSEFLTEDSFGYLETPIHADLGGDHILVDQDTGAINGIIDFGDIAIGDPAYDFYQQGSYGHDFLEEILRNYGPSIDGQFYQRMAFYDKVKPFHRILGGINLRKEDELKLGLEKLDQTIASVGAQQV